MTHGVSKKKCPNNKKEIYNDKYRHTRDNSVYHMATDETAGRIIKGLVSKLILPTPSCVVLEIQLCDLYETIGCVTNGNIIVLIL